MLRPDRLEERQLTYRFDLPAGRCVAGGRLLLDFAGDGLSGRGGVLPEGVLGGGGVQDEGSAAMMASSRMVSGAAVGTCHGRPQARESAAPVISSRATSSTSVQLCRQPRSAGTQAVRPLRQAGSRSIDSGEDAGAPM